MLKKVLLILLALSGLLFFGLSGRIAEASVGNASITIYAGTNPIEEFSSAKLLDMGDGKVDISVKLPGKTQFYILNRPLPFMRGWLASKDGSNNVTVNSPDGVKYIYPASYDNKLRYIKDANDRNIVVFDYTPSGLISKQSDGNDSDLYIEYGYEGGLLKTLTACDYGDCREYTITYDDSDRAIAFSGNCQECGSGAFRYEYDANDLLAKVRDANDPNIVLYEYKYNANGWATDIYLGEANDANHFRMFVYTSQGSGGDYIVDTYDYVDANTYRVTREYKNGAGLVTKRIRYALTNEDPSDPVGDPNTEFIFYDYDANNVMTRKVVIPPSRNSQNPDPNSGIRKEYTYDPKTGRMLTETWFASNEVNIPVISYTYEYVPDPCGYVLDVRVLSSIDARDANTVYSYDGNEVVPKLKEMPVVTGGISEQNQQLKYEYQYDNRKRVVLEKQLDQNDTVLVETKYDYDDYGNLIKRHDDFNDPNVEITEYIYNGFNEMTRMKVPLGDSNLVSGRSYYDNGLLKSEFVLANPGDINEDEPNLILQTKYFYDNNGRLERIDRAKDSNEFSYSSPGSWILTRYEYDVRGNRTKVIEDVNGLDLATSYEYNNQNEVTRITLPNGKWTQTIRDGRGLVAATIVGYGTTEVATTEFYYDANGNLIEEVAPNNVRTTYEYDDFDRVIKITRGL